MKKYSRTLVFAALTLLTVSIVYFFDAAKMRSESERSRILGYEQDQISYLQVIKGDQKMGLQKNENGWSLREPIQDQGDNENIERFLGSATEEVQISVVKNAEAELTETELSEFGLDKPEAIFNFKNNLGHTKKISVGSIKSYEGNTYLRVDSENRILLASPFWNTQAQNEMIYYRYKKLYRGNPAQIEKIKIKSLQETFEIVKKNHVWSSVADTHPLDQNRIRELIRKIVDTEINEYIFEGEPSVKYLTEKGLNDEAVLNIEMFSEESNWSVKINLNTKDKALYAFTERPTFFLKIELDAWEQFGNLKLDDLRDRESALEFNEKEVAKIYYKSEGIEHDIFLEGASWKEKRSQSQVDLDAARVSEVLAQIKALKISEFLPPSEADEKFSGDNMLILRSAADKLLLQLNWGPQFAMKASTEEKEYFYARTHQHAEIFAIEKKTIDDIGIKDLVQQPNAEKPGDAVEKN